MSPTLNIQPFNNWFDGLSRPLIISGPCSAESETQVLQTAQEIEAGGKVDIFRAGVWKPRTRPGDFEGKGEEALSWLQKVKKQTNLKIAIEVADPKHVELAIKYGIDILWIGARTVVNPFSVQAIADSLIGIDIPVLVKNPIHPDLKLWVGAIERVNAAGITKIAAIHRGFHYFVKSQYRNAPMWEIPIELKRIAPKLPIIVDPSHICGKTEFLQEISQKAMDLAMDGLMIESHIDPENARTDSEQQITPKQLVDLIDSLVVRNKKGNTDFQYHLEELRTEIDKLDGELLQILAKRMEIIDEIGDYKCENDITILQMKRWANIINDRLSIGENMNLDRKFLRKILNLIHRESILRQEKIFLKRDC